MADRLTIARPYARAAYRVAGGKLADAWSQALHVAASAVEDVRIARLLSNPLVSAQELADLVNGIIADAGGGLDEEGQNFVRILAANHRLAYLPEVAAQFDVLKDAAQRVVDVTVTSAEALDEGQREQIAGALEKRLDRKVRLHCEVDKELIGGAVLRAGDLVIDGSLRTRLERIAYQLTA
jgi:F-type H+-transporting ATPase subunit delta